MPAKMFDVPMTRINAYVDDLTKARLFTLGNGNLAAGIRLAAELATKAQAQQAEYNTAAPLVPGETPEQLRERVKAFYLNPEAEGVK